jgi:hypothetical protein
MMVYLRQQCKKRPPDVLLQREYYESDSCGSDEDHVEIDYPEDEENSDSEDESYRVTGRQIIEENTENDNEDNEEINEENNDVDDDDEWNFHQSYSFLIHRRSIQERKIEYQSVTCCICNNLVQKQEIRLDELDHHPCFVFTNDMGFINPCKEHVICTSCIRRSILSNATSILKDGAGNFPCLGDMNCKNNLRQRTTTYIHQLREMFSEVEWSTIMEYLRNFRSSQAKYQHHFYCIPLTPVSDINVDVIYNRIIAIFNQDQPRVQCPICTVTIQKTTACYAMRHCDWEICWMCSKLDRRLSIDHWKTCPRYDSNAYWKQYKYLCEESICHDDNHTCQNSSHVEGKTNMNHIRKIFQLHNLFKSVDSSMECQVIKKLQQNEPILWVQIFDLLKQYETYKMRC